MILYTSDLCGSCRTVKYMLDKLDVDYEVRNVSNKLYEAEMMTLTGLSTVPVFVKGDEYVIGNNFPAIRRLIV